MQLIIGIEDVQLTQNDITRLQSPAVAGVILFKRNYESSQQLKMLTTAIRTVRHELFISVDHEGGSVQRFKQGFTLLPPAKRLLEHFRLSPAQALALAESCGFITGIELQQHGIDFSYAPVLDLNFGHSNVIGNRSFGNLTEEVVALAGALMRGLHHAGMIAVGKHFPGHGGVVADTHHEIANDPRPLTYLWQADLKPFQQLIRQGLNAIMPAHVIYNKVDAVPAGFSKIWLQNILRKQMQFKGSIISDDLDMKAARSQNLAQTLKMASSAGCDLALICNHFDTMNEAISLLKDISSVPPNQKLFGQYIKAIPEKLLTLCATYRTNLSRLN